MSQSIERFRSEYQEYHGMSDKRAHQQRKELLTFAGFSDQENPEDCTADDLRSYMGALVAKGLHVNTVRKRGNMIRPFFKWAYSVGIIDGEKLMAMAAVQNPKGATGKSVPKPYTTKELRAFWADLDKVYPYVADKWWMRYWHGTSKYKRVHTHVMRVQLEAIVALALDCGLRQSEILHLSLDDMHYDNAYIVVRQRSERGNGKDRHREVPHTDASRTAVRNWLELREKLKVGHRDPWCSLAVNTAGRAWASPMREKRMKLLLKTVGPWHLHRFRHTCATNWLRAGMSLEVVSRLLGHASTSQTLAYAEIVRDDIERQVHVNEGRFKQMTGREREKV